MPPELNLFRESASFDIARIESVCVARNNFTVSIVCCEVSPNLTILTAQRKSVTFHRKLCLARTQIRQEAVFGIQASIRSPTYYVYLTNHHVYLDDEGVYPLQYIATDVNTNISYLGFKDFNKREKKQETNWL